MTEETQKDKFFRLSNPLMWGTLITLVFFLILIILANTNYCETLTENRICQSKFDKFLNSPPNEIGDTLAGIAGALAFLWIIITVLLQSQELKAQRLELSYQREELEKSRKESEKMNETMAAQLFENTFFELVSTYNSIVNSIDVTYLENIGWGIEPPRSATKTGRDSFEHFVEQLKSYHDEEISVDDMYFTFWADFQNELGHYFRFLYRAFKLISEHPHSQDYHAKILRSQLSDLELVILYYNCASSLGEKFRKYAVEFELFDNLPSYLLLSEKDVDLLELEAWGNNLTVDMPS